MSPVAFLLVLCLAAACAELPKGWKACSKTSPDFHTCLTKEIKAAIQSLAPGDKKLGVMPLDPLFVQKVVVPKHPGPVSVELTWSDVNFSGIKESNILEHKGDWEKAEVVAHIPTLAAIAKYVVDGKVMVLPIKGEGDCNITLHEVDMDINIKFKREETDGTEHLLMDEFIVDFKPQRVYVTLENLFNGDKALGDTTNAFLNENWREIYKELKPALQQAFSIVGTAMANKILSKIPASEIDVS